MASTLKDDEVGFSEINVTPLVDVVLVLLIIFMMSAPMIYQNSIKVSLPQAQTGESASGQESQSMKYTIDSLGTVYLQQKPITLPEIAKMLSTLNETKKLEPVFIQADKATPHGLVISLMDTLKKGGLSKFALTVESLQSTGSKTNQKNSESHEK